MNAIALLFLLISVGILWWNATRRPPTPRSRYRRASRALSRVQHRVRGKD